MERAVGPVIALLLLVVIGLGIYAYTLHGAVTIAEERAVVAEQKVATAQAATQDVEHRMSGIADEKTALHACQTQLQDATQRADAAEQKAQTPNGGGARSR